MINRKIRKSDKQFKFTRSALKAISDYIENFKDSAIKCFKIKPKHLEDLIYEVENYIKFLSFKHSIERKAEMVEIIDVAHALKRLGKPTKFIKSHYKNGKTYMCIQQSIAEGFLLLKRRLQLARYPKVLDAGCGWGRLLKRMHEGGYENIEMFGVDIDDFSLRYAKTINEVDTFIKSDIRMLPFKDETFDTVICNGVIHEIKESKGRYRAMQEIARVLKPNGLLYFHDVFSKFSLVRFLTQILQFLTSKVEWVLKRSEFEEILLKNNLKIVRKRKTHSHMLGIMGLYQYVAIKS